jgi:two-component system sensor histidine kinase KdpD
MGSDAVDPRWPRLLSLTVHEFRTPLTVVAGYLRMLLKDRAGPVSEQQRRLLEEAEKSCQRLSAILSEVSDLSGLEAGTAAFNRSSLELTSLLADVVTTLPELPDRRICVDLQVEPGDAVISGDAARLKAALTAVVMALRRELVTSDRLVMRQLARSIDRRAVQWVAIGDADRIDELARAERHALTAFDEWRGGCGLSLAVARRVIDAHGGHIWSPVQDGKAGAVIALPA